MRLHRYLTSPGDESSCHRVTAELNRGWELCGAPTLTYDGERKRVMCGQVIIKEAPGEHRPGIKLAEQ
ncbi:MAG: DUF1737 domain-containing protein [Hyphomicrobiaceae bacterium]|nr:MAG: DUF1737 domain-containing protein [Hyphomicrobiaceae bacterium]